MLLDVLGVLRDISVLFMCLLPALIVGGIGIYVLFVLRPWTKVDHANQEYVIANLRKGVDLTQKASTASETIGRKTITPIVALYSYAAGTQAFIYTLFHGSKPAKEPAKVARSVKTESATVIRAQRRSTMSDMPERRSTDSKPAARSAYRFEHPDDSQDDRPGAVPAEQQSGLTAAAGASANTPPPPAGRIDPYGQQPSAPSLPRTTPGSVEQTVENMIDTADANPELTPDQPGNEGATSAERIRVQPGLELNDVGGTVTREDARTDTPPRPLGDENIRRTP